MKTLSDLSNNELLFGLESLLGRQRELLARLLAHLIEVERRRLHLEQAYSSLFEFCIVELRMSEGEAFRRITAARLAERFPVVLELVASGAVHLSGLVLLREHLADENHAELLWHASGKSKRAIQVLVAERFPRPDVPSSLRKLPRREPGTGGDAPALLLTTPATPALATAPAAGTHSKNSPPAGQSHESCVEPLAPARYKVQFTASAELKDKLERARNLLSHANPGGDLAVIVERAVDLLLAELERSKLAKTERPRPSRGSRPGAFGGTVSRAARREVFARDAEQCSFVGKDGRRCQAKAFLEIDHVQSARSGRQRRDPESAPVVRQPQPALGRANVRPRAHRAARALAPAQVRRHAGRS